MKRKTKEVTSTARPKPKNDPATVVITGNQILQGSDGYAVVINLTADQHADMMRICRADSHGDRPAEWCHKLILRHVADRRHRI